MQQTVWQNVLKHCS